MSLAFNVLSRTVSSNAVRMALKGLTFEKGDPRYILVRKFGLSNGVADVQQTMSRDDTLNLARLISRFGKTHNYIGFRYYQKAQMWALNAGGEGRI